MASSLGPPSFYTQTNALLRKNLTYQKRNMKSNYQLIANPILFCLLLVLLQSMFDYIGNQSQDDKCGCTCVKRNGNECVEEKCGDCSIRHPQQWLPLLQVPDPPYRAVSTDFLAYPDLPDKSCKLNGSCPVTILLTGNNRTIGEILGQNMVLNSLSLDPSDVTASLPSNILGSQSAPGPNNYLDPAFSSSNPIYFIQSECGPGFSKAVSAQQSLFGASKELSCLQCLSLWRKNSSEINDELYKGYVKGNSEGKINEILAAYDFLNSNQNKFNVSIWYNSTYKNENGMVRVQRSVNLATNTYLRSLRWPGMQILFDFIKDMPKIPTTSKLDISSILGTLFFTWVILQLFPVILTGLVYEKQQKLRIMMKMHGLGDGPYWVISYAYFFSLSAVYMFCFVVFGSLIGLKFFLVNSYSIQFVFFFIYLNLQIVVAFLLATLFSNVKSASVIGYICVFGTGLIGVSLFQSFVQDNSMSRHLIILMELYPGFALYRGLYEFAQYVSTATSMGTHGMTWKDLSDSENGMKDVLVIMFVEWLVFLAIAYYIDKIATTGVAKGPLFFLQYFQKKPCSSFLRSSLKRQGSRVYVQLEKPDVAQERERVEQLLLESSTSHVIISDNIRKIHPGRDGNPEKVAVNGLSLALPSGECFGMLGPNGAGKTTFISMMIGITKPTAGTAYVNGFDIVNDMDRVYTSMGVCPQYDLLWETLTGREHLQFYGRLKNLEGYALTQAVEESLKNVNLFQVADKQAGQYSGGMKRRLSVAISLIGDPKAVYMDEPSTGLDPASRNSLWNAVKRAKQGRAIILTTHSMEEAEALCDRLGIFVDGNLQCIGNPKELKARYGGSYVFTITTSADHEEEVESMVRRLSPGSSKIYQISGTQKYELPKNEVRVADVFQAVEDAKSRFTVFAWGLADTTLENVFIKVANHAQAFQDS